MITTTQYSIEYTSTGAVSILAFPYLFLDNSHIVVVVTHLGVDTLLVLDVDYTVSGANNQAGGNITLKVIPPLGDKITIYRNVPLTQLMNYIDNDSFPAESHERALDKLTMALQQLSGGGVLPGNVPGFGIVLSTPSGTDTSKSVTIQTGSSFLVNAWLIDGTNTVPTLERTLYPPDGSTENQWTIITGANGQYTFTFEHTGVLTTWRLCVEIFGQVIMSDVIQLGV